MKSEMAEGQRNAHDIHDPKCVLSGSSFFLSLTHCIEGITEASASARSKRPSRSVSKSAKSAPERLQIHLSLPKDMVTNRLVEQR